MLCVSGVVNDAKARAGRDGHGGRYLFAHEDQRLVSSPAGPANSRAGVYEAWMV